MHLHVHCSVTYGRQDLEAGKYPSVDEWIKKAVVCLHNGILLGYKKEGNLTFVTPWMDLESIMLSEIRQPEEDKYHMISLICGI